MWVIWLTAGFLALVAGLVTLTNNVKEDTARRQESVMQADQGSIAEGIEQYTKIHGQAPANLDALTATDGFEHLRAARNPWQRYERSQVINDGVWNFQRAAAWTVVRRDGAGSYRTENACGTGDVATAQAWCGKADGTWYRIESKESYNDEMSMQRTRMMRTLQLFADAWTASQAFPAQGNDGASLGPGQQRSLATLAGYYGAADACTGVYVWRGIPLDCGALFDTWGKPVKYQYQSPTLIVLTTETPFTAADGMPVVVATPLQVQE